MSKEKPSAVILFTPVANATLYSLVNTEPSTRDKPRCSYSISLRFTNRRSSLMPPPVSVAVILILREPSVILAESPACSKLCQSPLSVMTARLIAGGVLIPCKRDVLSREPVSFPARMA